MNRQAQGKAIQAFPAVAMTIGLAALLAAAVGLHGAATTFAGHGSAWPAARPLTLVAARGGTGSDTPAPAHSGLPAFTGLSLYSGNDYAFWYPDGWQPVELGGERCDVVMLPADWDVETTFSVEERDTGGLFAEGDVPLLLNGFRQSLQSLPDYALEWEDHWIIGSLIGLEAKFTFSDGGSIRKRWTRLLFDDGRLYYIIAQGSSPEEYAYWEPHLFEMVTTVTLDNAYDWFPDTTDDIPQLDGEML